MVRDPPLFVEAQAGEDGQLEVQWRWDREWRTGDGERGNAREDY